MPETRQQPGEALAKALAECGCRVSTEEAACLAQKLLGFIRAGALIAPAELQQGRKSGDAA